MTESSPPDSKAPLGDAGRGPPPPDAEPALPSPESAESAGSVETVESAAPSASRRPVLFSLAILMTLVSLFGPLSASGIWDPPELKVADLARRIALTLLGATQLSLEGAVNTVPTLGELARGQLPFTSVALGFRLFGLHEWAGRLPLALWALAGIWATYALLTRLADRAAGAFAALVLATMPLYFLHARTILGEIVTMSALALAVAGLGIACFDRSRSGESQRRLRRVLWLLVGCVGLAAGFGSRGLLIGVVLPTLSVGLAWLVSGAGKRDALSTSVGVLALVTAAVAGFIGVRAVLRAVDHATEFSMLVGSAINKERTLPTFDFVMHQLGHSLFPWSAVLPFAIGRMLWAPASLDDAEAERQTALRTLLLIVPSVGLGIYGALAPVTGNLAFGPVFALAALTALGLREFERGADGSRAVAMGVAALAILFYYDFRQFPEKGLSAFAVADARFPDSFKESGTRYIKYGTLGFVALFFFSFMEAQKHGTERFVREEYMKWPRAFRTAWNGNLMFTVLVGEAALASFALLTYLSDRWFHWKNFQTLGAMPRNVASYGYIALPALIVAPLLALCVRDVFRALYSRGFGLSDLGRVSGWLHERIQALYRALPRLRELAPSRAVGALLSTTAFAAVLSLGYYPALAGQISPKEVFDSFRTLSKSGEALGMMGVGAGSASYYAGRDVPTFSNVATGFAWLTEAPARRWLVIRSTDLPQMNSNFRSRLNPPQNLPVLDARSSEILLVSNQLGPNEKNNNPFSDWILTDAPRPSRRVDGNFGNQLDAIGWDVKTPDGKIVDSVVPGKPYQFVIYYKVIAAISGSWETFVHIDGFQRRFNADHKTLDGKYPFHLWRVGDYIADYYTFTLEPNFTPGEYRVYYGLFMGNRRLEVKRGSHNEDRLDVGGLVVR